MYDKDSNDTAGKNCGESSFQEGLSWREGRRIVELGVLAEALGKCCGEGCSRTLDLRNTESEKRYSFASLFLVRYVECGALNSIKTRKSQSCKEERITSLQCKHKGSRSYDTFRIISYWNAEIYGKLRGTISKCKNIEKEGKRYRSNNRKSC